MSFNTQTVAYPQLVLQPENMFHVLLKARVGIVCWLVNYCGYSSLHAHTRSRARSSILKVKGGRVRTPGNRVSNFCVCRPWAMLLSIFLTHVFVAVSLSLILAAASELSRSGRSRSSRPGSLVCCSVPSLSRFSLSLVVYVILNRLIPHPFAGWLGARVEIDRFIGHASSGGLVWHGCSAPVLVHPCSWSLVMWTRVYFHHCIHMCNTCSCPTARRGHCKC